MAKSATTAPQPQAFIAPDMTKRQIWWVMIGLMLAMFLAVLDQTIVGTALWTIVKQLDPINGLAHMSWVVTAYILASTATQPLYGKISDIYGRKPVFMWAIGLFLIGSILSGASTSLGQLIGFRAIQGLGAGGLMSLAMAIIGDMVSPRERGKYSGFFGMLFGLGSVIGPFLGGYLTDPHAILGLTTSWRWVFYINIPLGLLALAVVQKVLQLPKLTRKHHIDYFGASLMVAGVSMLLLVTEWGGQEYAWGSPTILGMLAAGIALLGSFLWRESKADEPILPLHLFKNSVFRVAIPILFILGCAMFGSLIYVSLYFQIANGLNPTDAGLHLIPMSIGMLISSIGAGQIVSKTGRYKVFPIVGTGVVTLAMFLLGHLTPATSSAFISFCLFLIGFGMGCVMQIVTLAVQNSISREDMGTGSTATVFFRSLGGAVGSAAFGALLSARLAVNLPGMGGSGTPNPSALHSLPPETQTRVVEGFVHSTNTVFLTAAGVMAIAFTLSWFLKEIQLKETQKPPEAVTSKEAAIAID